MSHLEPPPVTDKRGQIIARNIFVSAVILLILATSSVLVWSVLAIRHTQVDNTARAQQTKSAAEDAKRGTQRIEDCTTPGRPCYERGQSQTAAAVGTINRVSIYAAACAARRPRQSVEQIQSCVIAELAKRPTPPQR